MHDLTSVVVQQHNANPLLYKRIKTDFIDSRLKNKAKSINNVKEGAEQGIMHYWSDWLGFCPNFPNNSIEHAF